MLPVIKAVQEHYGPDQHYQYAQDDDLRSDQRRIASIVGTIAIGLPVIVGALGWYFGNFRDSLSDYYYEVYLAGDIFVGSLIFIGALMTVYRGWAGSVAWLATVAGILSCIVAIFPARGWISATPRWEMLNSLSPHIHGYAALALFLILAFFCLFIFAKVNDGQHLDASDHVQSSKRVRNLIYRASGTIILLSLAAVIAGFWIDEVWAREVNLTFWAEAAALMAFGVSWLTHGRIFYAVPLVMDEADKRAAHAA